MTQRCIIDRFEGELAVCECDDRTMFTLPRAQLPAAAREGDCLAFADGAWQVDAQRTQARRERIAALRAKLLRRG